MFRAGVKAFGYVLSPRVWTVSVSRSASQYNVDTQRSFLLTATGGSVDMKKDETSGVATITLNHPKRKNAFSGKMMVDLSDIVSELEKWTNGKGILVHGVGNNFCSGGDLNLLQAMMKPEQGANMSHFMQDTLTRLFRLPLISVAVLDGIALGGGAELAVACDFRAATQTMSIGFVQAARGISTGWGGAMRLVQLVGRTNALRILASASVLTTSQAKDLGLVDVIVSKEGDSITESLKFLQILTKGNSAAIQAAKKTVLNALQFNYEQALNTEREIFESVWGGQNHSQSMSTDIKFTADKT